MKPVLLLLSFCLLLQTGSVAQNRAAALEEKFITIRGDETISYVEKGNPAGVPVILVHGYSDSWHSYDLVMPELPDYLHTFAISLRGHGNSSRPASGYTMESMATDIAAFMQAKHMTNAVIVGHSMGSIVAQAFAVRFPRMTRGLVLVGTFASAASHTELSDLTRLVASFKDPVDHAFVVEFQKSTLYRKVPDSFFQTAVEESMKVPATVWKQAMEDMSKIDYLPELRKLQVPTLLVFGDKDAICTRKDQDLLERKMRKASLLVYNGTGHAVHWEEPARFASDLSYYVNNLPHQ